MLCVVFAIYVALLFLFLKLLLTLYDLVWRIIYLSKNSTENKPGAISNLHLFVQIRFLLICVKKRSLESRKQADAADLCLLFKKKKKKRHSLKSFCYKFSGNFFFFFDLVDPFMSISTLKTFAWIKNFFF